MPRNSALLVATGVVLLSSLARAADRPNILFIAIDDQNDWIGCFGGHPQVKTPHIDQLAARGTHVHQRPLPIAAVQSLPHQPDDRTATVDHGHLRSGALVSRRRAVQGRGFACRSTWRSTATAPIPRARSTTAATAARRRTRNSRCWVRRPVSECGPKRSWSTRRPNTRWSTGACFPHQDEDKGDWKVASWAVEQLDAKPQEPFFLSVGFFLPHVPCYATQKWFDLYPEETLQLPPVKWDDRDDTPRFSWYLHWKLPEPRLKFLQEANQWKNLVRSYLACTSFVDSQVGRVLEALERTDYADNTVIVLWSDHGWHLGEKLITGKNTLWDRSARVPLIFAGPGVAVEADLRPAGGIAGHLPDARRAVRSAGETRVWKDTAWCRS